MPPSEETNGGPRAAPAQGRPRWAVAAVPGLAVILVYAALCYSQGMASRPGAIADETAYFGDACWIAEAGGPFRFLFTCASGDYPEDNRHILLQCLASPWARRSLDAVRPMRAVKAALAFMSLLTVWLVGRRAASPAAATLVVSLLSLNEHWTRAGGLFVVEPITYALWLVAWALIAGALRPRGRWLLAGLAVGLAYLAKGTALLLLMALPLAAAEWIPRHRRLAAPRRLRPSLGRAAKVALLFATGFLLTAWPLLARNTARFGNPLHNYNSRVLWMDNWDQHLLPESRRQPGMFTPSGYLRRHSLSQIVRRAASGCQAQGRRLLGLFAADRRYGSAPRLVTGALSVLLVSAAGVVTLLGLRRWHSAYTLALVTVSFILFAWYSAITDSGRFLSSVGPIVGIQAFRLLRRLRGPSRRRVRKGVAVASPLIAACAVLLMGWGIERRGLCAPVGRAPVTRECEFLLSWLRRAVHEGRVCFSTPYLWPRYEIAWLLPSGRGLRPIEKYADFRSLDDALRARGADYLIVERDSLGSRLDCLGDYFGHAADGALKLRKPPPGWRVACEDSWPPSDFIVLERGP